jgi:hypothetical protein
VLVLAVAGWRFWRVQQDRHTHDFRRVHGAGLFPPAVVSDRDFAAVDAWLKTLRSGRR